MALTKHDLCGTRATWPGLVCLVALFALFACGDDADTNARDAATGDAPTQDTDGGSDPTWATLAPLPQAVQETAVVELGGSIYVLGGTVALGTALDRVSVYDPASNTWSTAAALPAAVHHANAAVVDGKIYVLGSLFANFSVNPAAWEYDPGTDAWKTLADMPAGSERGAAAVAVIDGVIYLAGGLRSLSSVADFSSYTPATQTWDTSLDDMAQALNHGAGESVAGKFYVLGGRDVGIDGIVGGVQVYDPVGASWSSGAAMPTARGGMASGVVDGRIVLVGGEGNAAVASGVFPQVEAYDPAGDTWTSLPQMLTPRHGMGAVGFAGALYIPGGATVQGFGATDVHEALRF